jgi:hypothetical protein
MASGQMTLLKVLVNYSKLMVSFMKVTSKKISFLDKVIILPKMVTSILVNGIIMLNMGLVHTNS